MYDVPQNDGWRVMLMYDVGIVMDINYHHFVL